MNVLLSPIRSIHVLPSGIQQLIQYRLMATESQNLYPFPTHSNPSPHQIFHLSKGCAQDDIKNRYYELVRLYHPDAPHTHSTPASIRHSRFQAISSAYDILRGKSHSSSSVYSKWGDQAYEEEIKRRKAAYYAAAAARGNWDDATFAEDQWMYGYANGHARRKWTQSTEDVWKDRTIIWGSVFLAILTFVPFIYHSPFSAVQAHNKRAKENYAVARADAKIWGKERREALERMRRTRAEREKAERGDGGKEAELPR